MLARLLHSKDKTGIYPVHLLEPETHLFLHREGPVTAHPSQSVSLKLQPGAKGTEQQKTQGGHTKGHSIQECVIITINAIYKNNYYVPTRE